MARPDEGAGNESYSEKEELSQEIEAIKPDPVDELRKECEQINERFLRLAADFDNYRKQVARERESIVLLAGAELLRELLPIADDLGRAVSAVRDEASKEGIVLLQRNLEAVLTRHGVEKIDSIGKKFDPALHEALCSETSTREEGTILEEFEIGYTLKKLLLRPAKVKIATKPAEL